MIHLHTLGDALIKVGEKEIRPTAPLVFAALLYLGMERGRRVPRAALQELLFPNGDERSGAHSLRQLLYKLRQLGAPLDADASTVAVEVDDVRDDSATDLSLSNGHVNSLDRYAQGLLPDYAPKLSERYDQWLESRRATVAASIRRQLVAGMKASRDAINWPAVEQFAHAILEIDPFNEEATLALAEAAALSGAKAKALAILSDYEQETGRSDLRIASSLLRRRISESVPEVSRRVLETPFLGREADAEAVRHQILEARSGKPSLVVIAGEPGIGKTRLLEESAGLAALEGVRVQVVRCQPHYSARPLGVFIELVPPLLASRGALGVSPHSLAHLNYLTSHSDDRGDRPSDARDDATRSGVLLAALRDLVDAVATETPLLLAIEDAHWADQDSLRELSALVQGASSRCLTVVFTTRFLEPLKQTITDAAIIRRLKPLSAQRMAELARHLLPHNGNGETLEEITSWCVQTASGNPLFLRMLCAHYTETGQPFTVPPDLVSATTRRIEQLPQECRRILEFSALLGRHSTIDALRSLAECTQLQLLNAVQRLEEDGYLQIRGDAVRITHDLLSECTLNLVPPLSQRVLHSCVAANLEVRYDSTHDAALLWDCAEQWTVSGESGKALEFLKRCAQHAAHIGRAAQALTLLERAKQLAKYPAEVADVLGKMMFAAKAADQWNDVFAFSQQLAVLPQECTPAIAHTDQELVSVEASWFTRSEAGQAASRLLACSNASTASAEHRVDAACLLLKIAHERCDPELAARAYGAVEHLIDAQPTRYSNRILPILYHATFGDRDRALMLGRTLVQEFDTLDSVGSRFRAAMNTGTLFLFLGEYDEAFAIFAEFYNKASKGGMKAWQQDFCSQACTFYVMQERFEDAQVWYDRLEPLGGPTIAFGYIHIANGLELALWKHDVELASKRREAGTYSEGESLRKKAYFRGIDVRLQQLDPQFDCDGQTLRELLDLFETTKRLTCADCLAHAIGEALRRQGKQKEARQLLGEYIQFSRRERSPIPPSLAELVSNCSEERVS